LKDNAIPREACAVLLVSAETDAAAILAKVQELDRIYKDEYRLTDPTVSVTASQNSVKTARVLSADSTARVLTALTCLPNGIERMSFDMEGLVQTSLNLGILNLSDHTVSFSYSVRSSVESEKQALIERISCLAEALSGTVRIDGDYPAWEYRNHSPLRETMITVFEQMYGRKPVVQSIHAGVECGLFAGKLPGLDCVSFGPDMKNIHTTEERMDTESVRRTWEYLLAVLKQLNKKEFTHE
jgi:dipeptidase D